MSRMRELVIVAEVGKRAGWGHVVRSALLRRILSAEYPVTLKVVNRSGWDDDPLALKYALNSPIEADIVFVDGLTIHSDVARLVNASKIVSLSYMSDINTAADFVVAPAMHGMNVPSNYLTDLSALLCNRPIVVNAHKKFPTTDREAVVGVCMGGDDVDCITPVIDEALRGAGYRTRLNATNYGKTLSLSSFLERKLEATETDTFPHYRLADCDIVVCQGGLSAIEFALLGIPTVIRRRPDFADAYRFLETLGCSLPTKKDDVPALVEAVSLLAADNALRERMSRAGYGLEAKMKEDFWLSLVKNLLDGVEHEAMSLLRW